MPTNPYASPIEPSEPSARAKTKLPPKTLLEALWRGTIAGMKWGNRLSAGLTLLIALAFVAYVGFASYATGTWFEIAVLSSVIQFAILYAFLLGCGIALGFLVSAIRYACGWRAKEV